MQIRETLNILVELDAVNIIAQLRIRSLHFKDVVISYTDYMNKYGEFNDEKIMECFNDNKVWKERKQ